MNSSKPQIIFLDFFLKYGSISHITSAALISCKIVPGNLKIDYESKTVVENGDLLISFADDSLKILKTINIGNPLLRKEEYSDEDGNLNWSEFKVSEREYSLRTKFVKGTTNIIVKMIYDSESIDSIELVQIDLRKYLSEDNN